MKRDYTVYLLHILDSITIIESYVAELTEDSFRQNRLIQDGVIRNLEIIGEATKKLPKRLTNKYPDIEWKKMAGMRDVLIHDYFGVDLKRVWGVVKTGFPTSRKISRKFSLTWASLENRPSGLPKPWRGCFMPGRCTG